MAWLTHTSMVFPLAMLAAALLSFVSAAPTVPIVALFGVALLPWALIAGGVHLPGVPTIAITVGATAWLVFGFNDQPALFLPIIAIAWAAAEGHRLAAVIGVVGGTVAALGCSYHAVAGKPSVWAIWGTGMLFGWFTGTLLHRQQRLVEQVSTARRELELAAAAEERKQIAREVHDIVGHSLTVVLLNIAGARRQLVKNPGAAAEALDRAESVSRESLDTVRAVVGLLSTSDDSQTDAPLPGGADVVPLLERARASGLPLRASVDGDPAALEPAVGLTLVRLLQEALSNASRHAPGMPVDVTLSIAPHAVEVVIANDAPAVAAEVVSPGGARSRSRQGLGLSSMSERVTALHGVLDAGPRNDRWIVRGVLPRSVQVLAAGIGPSAW